MLKLRNTISFVIYDGKYSLELTRINIKSGFIPGKDIVESYIKADGDFPMNTVPYDESGCKTAYRGTSIDTPSKIYLSLNGDSVKTIIKNDSVAYYYLRLKSSYLQYKPGGIYEITAESKNKLYFLPMSLP